MGGYRTRLTGLSRQEAEALFLAGLTGPAEDMGLAEAVAAARLKVLAALPASLQDAPARTGQRFHLDVAGWFDVTGPPPMLAALARAVWRDETVVLRYRRDREVTRRPSTRTGSSSKAASGTWSAGWTATTAPIASTG